MARLFIIIYLYATFCISIALAHPVNYANTYGIFYDNHDFIQPIGGKSLTHQRSKLTERSESKKVNQQHSDHHRFPNVERHSEPHETSGATSSDNILSHVLGDIGTLFSTLTNLISHKYGVRPIPPDFQNFWATITGGQEWPGDSDSSDHNDPTFSSASSTSPASTSSPTSSVPSSPPSATSTYSFDPMSRNLNAVYYSQTDLTSNISLPQICADPAIDIVTLAFITSFFQAGGYPTLNLGSHCWAPNAAQVSAGATGLIDCVGDGFASQVAACQEQGKKVMLSLGGAISNTEIPDEDKASELADTLWNLFLGGTQNETLTTIRPFGNNVVLDGIDIDNETPANAQYLPKLASSLRNLFQSDTSGKSYYLSAAPQCPRPDASIPILPNLVSDLDFVSVQFYNNPTCDFGSSQSFFESLQSWSSDLASASAFNPINNGVTSPRLLLGVPAFSAAGSGYVPPGQEFESILDIVRSLDLQNLAGLAYWDGAYQEISGQQNQQHLTGNGSSSGGGESYAEIVRRVLS